MIRIMGRELIFGAGDQRLGTDYDGNSAVRVFKKQRSCQDGVDLAELSFYAIVHYEDGDDDVIALTKSVDDKEITLVWSLSQTTMSHEGFLFVWIRGFGTGGTVRWSSYKSVMYIEDSGEDPDVSEYLTLIEQIIAAENSRVAAESGRVSAENTREANEAKREAAYAKITGLEDTANLAISYAVGGTGTRAGENTDNAKYYKEQAEAEKELAAQYGSTLKTRVDANTSAIASESSTRAAADQNLQAQISQIVTPSGEAPSAAEVQNARVGADGVTYPTLGEAIRANDSQLKSHLGVTNEEIGIYTAEHYYSNSLRWAIIPFDFENGKSYFIDVKNSANNLSEIRIASAGNISTDTRIKSWNVSGVKNYSVTYNCNVDNATHLIIITPSTNTSISVDYAISQFNVVLLNERIGTAEGNLSALETYTKNYLTEVKTIGFQKNVSYTITNSGVVVLFDVNSANASGFVYQANGQELSFSPIKYGTLSDGRYLFTIPTEYILVVDPTDIQNGKAQLKVKRNNEIVISDICLLYYFASDSVRSIKGILGDYFADINIQSEIDDILDQLNKNTYPSYYDANNYLKNKVEKINNNAPLNGGIFSFITDMHFGQNQMNSVKLLKAIEEKTGLRMVVCGGDFVDAYGDDSLLNEDIQKTYLYANMLYPNWIAIRGNHDFTIRESAGSSAGITLDDAVTYNAIVRPSAEWRYEVPTPEVPFLNDAFHINKNYCWVMTNEQAKIKIIGFCDFPGTNTETYWGVTGVVTNAYAKYLAQMLLDCNGYSVIVVTHAALSESIDGSDSNARKVVTAFATKTSLTLGGYVMDFSNSTATFLFSISGHSHKDQFLFENSIVHVNTTCDATYNNDGYGRVAGTITEHAFDVFNIDTDNKIAYATRIGAGYDRIIHCEPVVLSNAQILTPKLSGSLTWTSSDTAIATVTSGTVTKVSDGECYILATAADGSKEYWSIKAE